MTLGQKQRLFTKLLAELISWAYDEGYENLFKDGEWLPETEDHKPIGEKWESMHELCEWGGSNGRSDGNHYSLSHWGRW